MIARTKQLYFIRLENFAERMLRKQENSLEKDKINGRSEECCLGWIKPCRDLTVRRKKINEIVQSFYETYADLGS